MGQTLTHGVYLPDEGERNCYAGLAANWQLLDSSVGTIASHTTALAGKAPLVHTHTKSDITDLFNSANTWSGDNTYSKYINYKSSYTLGNLPAGATAQSAFRILDSTGTDFICDINSFQNTLATGLRFTTRNKMDANGFSPSGTIKAAYLHFLQNAENKGYLQWDGYTKNSINPLVNNTYDLGSSSYQWNKLYSKEYYYNGTEFQSKFVTTDTTQTIDELKTFAKTGTKFFKSINLYHNLDYKLNTPPSSKTYQYMFFMGNSGWFSGFVENQVETNGESYINLCARNTSENSATVRLWCKNATTKHFSPMSDNEIDLGISSYRWKTLNGVNPGALSLPQTVSTNIDTTNWNLRGGYICYITHTVNCYICIQIQRPVDFGIWAIGVGRQTFRAVLDSTGNYLVMVWFPCIVNVGVQLYSVPLIDTPAEAREPDLNIQVAKYFPCQGNV